MPTMCWATGRSRASWHLASAPAPTSSTATSASCARSAVGQYQPGEWKRVDLTGDTSCRVFGWPQWIQIGAMLFRRGALDRVGGHDAAMTHIEEVNLYLRLALDGARFLHDGAPDVAVWHRKHRSVVSLGASNRAGFHAGCLHNVRARQMRAWQSTPEGLTPARRKALLDDYEFLARFYYVHDRPMFRTSDGSIESLTPNFVPSGPPMLRRLSQLIGYERAEAVALRYRDVKQRWRSIRGQQADEGFWHKPSMAPTRRLRRASATRFEVTPDDEDRPGARVGIFPNRPAAPRSTSRVWRAASPPPGRDVVDRRAARR